MEEGLKNLSGIEYKLYYEIVVNNKHATKAVDKVAFAVGKDPSTLWKIYYPKIKKELKKLEISNK